MAETTQRVEAWSQFILVVLTLLGALWFLSGRLSSIDQWEQNADTQRGEMQRQLDRMEQRLDGALDGGAVHGNH